MLIRIFKNDFKRKKTMNIILLLFIILATIFAASGLSNLISVVNGLDYYFDKADIGDYVVLTMGKDSVGNLEKIMEDEEAVKGYRIEPVVYAGEAAKDNEGNSFKSNNAVILQSIETSVIHFFDEKNDEITNVEKGHVIVTGRFMEDNHLQMGDVVNIELCGEKMSFILDGAAKDALFGSAFMGNIRFILNEEDMQKLLENELIYTNYRGEICYIDTDDVSAMTSALSSANGVAFDGARSTLKMCYVMELIVVFIVLILSVCLILVSFVVLKFSIDVSISEEFRELGMMKAIGIRDGKIRSLYMIKYFILGVLGSLIGVMLSFPFGKMLLNSATKQMFLGNDNEMIFHIVGGASVVLIILLFAYKCTGRIKVSSPIDAIRQGNIGESYQSNFFLKRSNFKGKTAFFMALNDILSKPRRYLSIVISFSLCTLFVLLLVNTTETMKSDRLIKTFGTEADLYITDVESSLEHMTGTKEELIQTLDEMSEELRQKGMPNEVCQEAQYKYTVTVGDRDYKLTLQQGINTDIGDYDYTEGLIPENAHEIAITPKIAELTGLKIGDTATIHFGDQDMDCVVTAYYQTMNQLGEVVRLHPDAPTDFAYISSLLQYQIKFLDDPSEEEIQNRKEIIEKLWNYELVEDKTQYCISCIGVVDNMMGVQMLLLFITLIVVILVSILMERSFIAEEKSQIALLKALGFRNRVIVQWHVYRMTIVAFVATVLAGFLSIPMTKLCITPIFAMMGAHKINYNIRPVLLFLVYPGIVLGITIFATYITTLYTKKIKSRDTASIE